MIISVDTVKNLMLNAQGLSIPPKEIATKNDLLETIRKMGYLQIDTISVVNRSQHVVLWSRLGNYNPKWLDGLLEEKKIFEYWSHAMCFLPIEDYPLYRRLALDKRGHWGVRTEKWFGENKKSAQFVLNYIKKHGETRSSDFKKEGWPASNASRSNAGWWNWKVEKIALEVLFDRGDLMITRRHNFHRHYNLRERVLPKWEDKNAPQYDEVQKALAIKAVKALGAATPEWISDYFYMPKREIQEILKTLLKEKEIYKVEIENQLNGRAIAYVHSSVRSFDPPKPTYTTLLSPFDPLVNNRKRALALFDFDYKIECYTPAPKRKYGYFTLPILHRGSLIGRLDPKAHRKEGVFEVKSVHLEPGVTITDQILKETASAIKDFADWHNCSDIKIVKSNPKEFGKLLQKNL